MFGIDLLVLLKIIGIDLILSADNAILIALAAKNLPEDKKKVAILWGTAGAVILRLLFAFGVTWLMKIPFLTAIGGLLLVWIAYKLLADDGSGHHQEGGSTVWSAIKTIIIADAAMSFDNVVALAGVAHGNFMMILLGIIISIPMIVWGSKYIIIFMNKFPIVMYIGAGILTWTAGEMVIGDKNVAEYIHIDILHYLVPAVITVVILGIGFFKQKSFKNKKVEEPKE